MKMNKEIDKKKLPLYLFGTAFIAFLLVFGGYACLKTSSHIITGNVSLSVDTIKDDLNNDVWIKESFITLNGDIQSVMGQRVSNGVAESDGYFALSYDRIDNASYIAESIISLKEYADEKGIPFVFVATPYKGEMPDFVYPLSVSDFTAENAEDVNSRLIVAGIDFLDLHEYITTKADYYRTDHHWRIETAQRMSGVVAQRLMQYGVTAKSDIDYYSDASNYEYRHATDTYLGSLGRKAGAGFTGYDEFSYVIPRFDTLYRYMHIKGEETVVDKSGTFEQAILSDPSESDYYCSYLNNSYCEMIIQNKLCTNGKRLLMISDSYGRPLAAFMSMYFSEVKNVDTQKDRYTGSIYDLIDEYNPDAVVLCYNSILYTAPEAFDFNAK